MKNIRVLPTDKPSRLQLFEGINEFEFQLCSKDSFFNKGTHIYITNDEVIKEGDWCIYNSGEIIQYLVKLNTDNLKKIILTTDLKLIKDGVQAIDDDFLEWFVSKANDSGVPIDIVEVESFCKNGDNCPSQGDYYKQHLCDVGYKIIIPKEEQKQNLIDMMQDDEKLGLYDYGWCKGNVVLPNEENCCTPIGQIKRYVDCKGCDRKPNKLNLTQLSKDVDDVLDKETKESMSQWLKEKRQQETLEEAAERLFGNIFGNAMSIDWAKDKAIELAKWQAERMYSEEEVLELLEKALTHKDDGETGSLITAQGKIRTANFYSWFERFKKK